MIRFNMFIFTFILFTTVVFSQTTYYVSSSQGSDSNSGTSENSPFKTIDKVNNLNLNPGDKVLFKSGDKWVGENLIINSSGTENNRIEFSGYGSGEKPIITLREEVPRWNVANNWTQISSNIWRMEIAPGYTGTTPTRLWINGIEYTISAGVTSGDNYDGTNGITSTHRFYTERENFALYVYAKANPASAYSSIEYPGSISSNGEVALYPISLIDADYVMIDGLRVEGGLYGAIGIAGSDYAIIRNSNIGKYSQWAGIYGNSTHITSTDNTSDNVAVENCTIYSGFDIKHQMQQFSRSSGIQYGIVVGNGASNWTIRKNLFKNWCTGVFCIAKSGESHGHNIYQNEFTSTINYGYPVVFSANEIYGNTEIKFYNNYCNHMNAGIELASSNNKIFFNIFAHYTGVVNMHSPNNSGWGLSSFSGTLENADLPEDNYIFNNTFYDMLDYAYLGWGKNEYWYNNLFINTGQNQNNIAVRDGTDAPKTWKNNLFYAENVLASINLIIMDAFSPAGFTVKGFNSLNGNNNKIISGNIQYVGQLNNLIDTSDFSLPEGSPALNAGVDISSIVDFSLKDRFGNLVDTKNPNIGAIDNEPKDPTGLKIFLEGPYSNNSMSTKLNDEGMIPKSQPYNVSPWNYSGNESVSEIPKDIVDWVLVELRNVLSPSTTVVRKAAFVRSDGNITALDGVSKLSFDKSIGTYYVVIKHRNHLAVMSSLPVLLINGNIVYDFTTSSSKAYGSSPMVKLDDGVYGMYGGDVDANGIVESNDVTDISSNLFKSGYKREDADMNSPVNVLDYKLPNENKAKSSQAASE